MTLVVAMALMAIAMALSYSVLRTQGTQVQIQANSNLRERARQAAWSGFAAGLRNMHQSTWGGVDSGFNGAVSSSEGYSVRYATGDPSLTSGSTQYSDYPYRVTLSVTGTATNPAKPGVTATHSLQAVVRLAPVQLANEPANWSATQRYTVYQRTSSDFTIDWPCRFQGDLYLRGTVSICPTYPYPFAAVTRYLSDLAAMSNQGVEYRPLSGVISLPYSDGNSTSFRNWLTSTLGVATSDNKHDSAVLSMSYPGPSRTYQLYPGGATYQVRKLSNQLKNTTLAPDALTNPLGLFYVSDDLSLQGNVNITGTLVCDGDLSIDGSGVSLQSYALPALAGSTQAVHLPAVISGGDFRVNPQSHGWSSQTSIQGVIAAFGDFVIESDYQNASFALVGRIISSDFMIEPRREWQFSTNSYFNAVAWQYLWNSYNSQPGGSSSGNGHGNGNGNGNDGPSQPFPLWLAQLGLTYTPSLTFAPKAAPPNYHWKKPNDAIYVPGPGDPGLRWDVLSIADNP
jgi:Tfp pilus assembly protein PilX